MTAGRGRLLALLCAGTAVCLTALKPILEDKGLRGSGFILEAISVLKEMGPLAREAAPALLDLCREGDFHYYSRGFAGFPEEAASRPRVAAAAVLARIGPRAEAAAGALRKALRDRDPAVRKAAAAALRMIEGS